MNTASNTPAPADDSTGQPWWRFGMVWLVVGGPLVVVVAAIVTAVIAVRGADPVITEIPAAMKPGAAGPTSLTPAVQARNHAATAGR